MTSQVSKSLFATVLFIGGLTLIARLAALAREMAIANEFGVTPVLDAYLIAFATPLFLLNAVSATFGPALAPHLIRARAADGSSAVNLLIRDFNARAVIALVMLVIAAMIASWLLLPLVTTQMEPQARALTRTLSLALMPYALMHGLGSMWIATLNAGQRFALPAIVPALTPLAVLAMVVMFADQIGVSAMVWGAYGGSLVELSLLGLMMRGQAHPILPKLIAKTRDGLAAFKQVGPLFLSAAALNLIPLFDQMMAAQAGPGEAATFNFATRLVLVGNSIAMLALSQTITPIVSRLRQDGTLTGPVIRRAMILFGLGAGALALGIGLFSETLTSIVFERGALSAADAIEIASVQRTFAAQLPFYIVFLFLSRVLAAFDGNRLAAVAAFCGAGSNVVLNAVLLEPYGLHGIAVATIASYVIAFAVLAVLAGRRQRLAKSQD